MAWFFGNAAIGLAPLLFLMFFIGRINEKEAEFVNHEIARLIAHGIVLFVCCALMGAVMIDILIEKIYFKKLAFFCF